MKKNILTFMAVAAAASMLVSACGGSSSGSTTAAGSTAAGSSAAGSSAAGSSAAAASGDKTSIQIGTGGTTGTYYAVGGVMATVLNPVLTLSNLTVSSTGASKANIQLIDDDEAQLALVQNDVMYYAYTGTDLFEDEGKYESFSSVAGLYDETVQIITCNADIKTVADLKGKKVSVGDAGSGVEFNAKQVLEAYDLTFDDITVVNASFGDSADSLKDGKIDAAFIVAGAPTTAVVDLATTKEVHVVQLDADHIKKLQDKYDFYTETVIPKDTYKGLTEDATTVSVRATLIASNKLSEDVVYELTKTMFDKQKDLEAAHEKFKYLNLQDAVKGISVPFHPGAKKYYTEQGVTVQ